MSDDYEVDYDTQYEVDYDTQCPNCGHTPTHYRQCTALGCDDGFVDEYDDDPINYAEGEEYAACDECHGTGVQRWCPQCGADLIRTSGAQQPL